MALIDEIKKAKLQKKIKSDKDSEFLKIEAEIISVLGCEPSPEGTRDELRAWMVSKCADPKWHEYSKTKNKKQEGKVFVDQVFNWTSHQYTNEQAKQNGEKHGHRWCHMWADDENAIPKLHAIAKKIGLKTTWFQDKPGFPHYDLVPTKRSLAIESGAIELDLKDWMKLKQKIEPWLNGVRQQQYDHPTFIPPEISEAENPFSCPACGSLEVWLPRVPGIDETKPESWRCCKCQPTKNRTLVLKVRSGVQRATEGDSSSLETFESQDAPKSIVVAQEGAACPECKCSWVRETPTGGGNVDLSCWVCGTKIDPERKIERREFKPFRFTKAERVA